MLSADIMLLPTVVGGILLLTLKNEGIFLSNSGLSIIVIALIILVYSRRGNYLAILTLASSLTMIGLLTIGRMNVQRKN